MWWVRVYIPAHIPALSLHPFLLPYLRPSLWAWTHYSEEGDLGLHTCFHLCGTGESGMLRAPHSVHVAHI